ncbi:MarR family transcriptional regulator [uncultured Enterococcus sp.]|uniref:MarR family transcriptional regulator n=1 Tax=uncultured Enterococcus sp. TaxID=167972 RepID=UPI002AA8BCAE|nr:MarR family transcriptional regulator [uncultured Enterococcus sp.]
MPVMEVTEGEQQMIFGFRKCLEENNESQLKIVEETYFAKSKQTIFTKAELAKKWSCSTRLVSQILNDHEVKPVGKRGKEHEFDIEQAQAAKENHDKRVLRAHELSMKIRAM